MQQATNIVKEIITTKALKIFWYFCFFVMDLKTAVVIMEIKAPIVINT